MEVLECLKKYGQRLDLEIAKEMEMPLASVNPSPLPVPTVVDTAIPLKDLIKQLSDRLEAEYITRLLREYRGNIKKSYIHAGISRRGFFEKMRQYGIRKEDFK